MTSDSFVASLAKVDQHTRHALGLKLLLDAAQVRDGHAVLRGLAFIFLGVWYSLHLDLVHRDIAPRVGKGLVRVLGQRLRLLHKDLGVTQRVRQITPAAKCLAPQLLQLPDGVRRPESRII